MINLAIDTLILKRADLVYEQARMNEQFNAEISELETAIEKIAGKRVWDMPIVEKFDDENPNYIKSSIEN